MIKAKGAVKILEFILNVYYGNGKLFVSMYSSSINGVFFFKRKYNIVYGASHSILLHTET